MVLLLCPRANGQADAGNAALRVVALGLLAVGAVEGQGRRTTNRRKASFLRPGGGGVRGDDLGRPKWPHSDLPRICPGDGATNAAVSYVAYLGQMFYPAGLAAYYPHPGRTLPVWEIGGAVLLLLTISVAVLRWSSKHPYLLVGWLWYLGMLVPVIGLVQVGAQARADRYTYLPQIGASLLAVWGAADLAARWRWRPLACSAAAGAMLAVLAACAWRQASYWHDNLTLWNHALACTSDNHFAHNSLGAALDEHNRADEAIEHYRLAVAIAPNYAMAYNNLGIDLHKKGQLDEAARQFRLAIEVDPQFARAHSNLATILHAQGKENEAIEHFGKALAINDDLPLAHNNLGAILDDRGRSDEAIAHYRKATGNQAGLPRRLLQSWQGVGPSRPARSGDRRVSEGVGDSTERGEDQTLSGCHSVRAGADHPCLGQAA